MNQVEVEVENTYRGESSPLTIGPPEGKENSMSVSEKFRCHRVCPYDHGDGNRLVSKIRVVNGNGAFCTSEFSLIPTWNSGFTNRLKQLKQKQTAESKRQGLRKSANDNSATNLSDKDKLEIKSPKGGDNTICNQDNQSDDRRKTIEASRCPFEDVSSLSQEDVVEESSTNENKIQQEKEIPKIPVSIIIEYIGSYTNDRKVWNALASLNKESFALSKNAVVYRPWPSIRWRATTANAKDDRSEIMCNEQRRRRRNARGAIQTSARPRAVDFGRDYLCYATDRGDVLFRGVNQGGSIHVRRGHVGCINSIKCYGNWVVSAGDDLETRIWNIKTMSCEAVLDDHTDSITSISILHLDRYSKVGRYNSTLQYPSSSCMLLATAGIDGDVHLYAVYCEGDKVLYTKHLSIFAEENNPKSIFAVVLYEKNGNINLIAGGLDGRLRLWDVDASIGDRMESYSNKLAIEIPAIRIFNNTCIYRYDGEIKSIAISRDKERIAVAFGRTICYSYLSGKTLESYDYLHHHDHNHRFQRRLAQQRRLRNHGPNHQDDATNSVSDNEEDRWKVLKGHSGDIRCIDFSPDGRTVASACSDGSIRLWQLGEGTWRRKWKAHNGFMVSSLAVSPDGQSLLSAGSDGTIAIEDLFP